MDDDTKEMVTSLLPALTRCPQHATEQDYDKMGRISATSYTA
jgi:hypothetical protein